MAMSTQDDRKPWSARTRETRDVLDWRRLHALEALWNPGTLALLDRLGLGPGWRCLEAGAGIGSVAHWLADRCPRGLVVATDIDVRYMSGEPRPNLDFLFHDLVDGADFPEAHFDLIHCRAVLAHVPEREHVLDRAARWLRPGGWLVVEEPALFPVDSSPHPLFRTCVEAHARLMKESIGTDLHWARTLPAALGRAGLQCAGMTAQAVAVGDGGPGDEFWRVSFEQLGPAMVDAGMVDTSDLEQVRASLDGSEIHDLSWALVAAWARTA